MLTYDECLILLRLIEEKHGKGWSADQKISALQAKLSLWLAVKSKGQENG